MLQIGTDEAWLWVAKNQYNTQTNSWVYISRHMNRIAAESLLRPLITIYGKHIVYSDGETWCPEACIFLGLEHRLHSPYDEKSIVVKRTIEYLKDKTEAFDDYFPCLRSGQSAVYVQMANSFCVHA